MFKYSSAHYFLIAFTLCLNRIEALGQEIIAPNLLLEGESDSISIFIESLEGIEKVDFLLDQANIHAQNHKPQIGIEYAIKALQISEQISYTKGQCKAFLQLGYNYHELGAYYKIEIDNDSLENESYQKSFSYLEVGLKLALENNLNETAIDIYIIMTYNYRLMYNNPKAVESVWSAVQIAKKTSKTKHSSVLGVMSSLFYYNGQYEQALEFEFRRLKLLEEEQIRSYENAEVLLSIGNIFLETKDSDQAKEFLLNSIEMYTELKASYNLIDANISMGAVYFREGNFSVANDYFNKSLKILNQRSSTGISDVSTRATIQFWQGNLEHQQNNWPAAIAKYQEANDLIKDTYSISLKIDCLNKLGDTHSELSNFGKANTFFKEAMRLAKVMGYRKEIMQSYQYLGDHHNRQGKLDEAF